MVDEAKEVESVSEGIDKTDDRAQDLDSLLSEFDGDEATPDSKEEKIDDYGRKAYEMLQIEQQRRAQEQYRKDMDSAVKSMREVIGKESMDGTVLEAYLEAEARKDTRIAKAFQFRYDKPDAWKSVVKEVAKKAKKSFATDSASDVEESLDAVRASVKSKTDEGPTDDEYSMDRLNKMSDWELQKTIMEYAKKLK